ncbi:MAG TPA: hypothetical protein P5307_07640, partial [Pirellulaceae bacterium]|nr:hypothetical protein [Pirellulaceae bacterium]
MTDTERNLGSADPAKTLQHEVPEEGTTSSHGYSSVEVPKPDNGELAAPQSDLQKSDGNQEAISDPADSQQAAASTGVPAVVIQPPSDNEAISDAGEQTARRSDPQQTDEDKASDPASKATPLNEGTNVEGKSARDQPDAGAKKPNAGAHSFSRSEPRPAAQYKAADSVGSPTHSEKQPGEKRSSVKYDTPMLVGADPEQARRKLQAELEGIQSGIEGLRVRKLIVNQQVMEALLCADLKTEYPGDRLDEQKRKKYSQKNAMKLIDMSEEGVYQIQ